MPNHSVKSYIILISITAAFAGLLFGIDTGVISGALPFLSKEFNISTQLQEYVVSSVLLGALCGTLIGSYLAKAIGRKLVLFSAAIIFAIASILSGMAISPQQLIVYRILLGLGVGMAAFIAPIYLSEMAPKKYRGGIVTMYQVMVYAGILIAFISDTYFSYQGEWRWMLGIIAAPAFIMALFITFLPRSPRWLLSVGKTDHALKVLQKIRLNEQEVNKELEEIQQSIALKQRGFSLFFSQKRYRHVVWLGVVLQAMQQFTGINMVIYYAPKVFSLAGFATTAEQMLATVLMGVVNVVACAASIYFVDKHGRKPLLYLGYALMAVSLGILSYTFSLNTQEVLIRYAAVTSLFIFLIAFAISSGPIIWILCAEIFPLKGREFGMCVATCTNWLCNMLLAATFLSALNLFGSVKTFFAFAVFNAFCLWLIFQFIPETKEISLEHIEKNLMSGKKLKNIGV